MRKIMSLYIAELKWGFDIQYTDAGIKEIHKDTYESENQRVLLALLVYDSERSLYVD